MGLQEVDSFGERSEGDDALFGGVGGQVFEVYGEDFEGDSDVSGEVSGD